MTEYPVDSYAKHEPPWTFAVALILLGGLVAVLAIAGGLWLGFKVSAVEIEGDDGAPIDMRVIDSAP